MPIRIADAGVVGLCGIHDLSSSELVGNKMRTVRRYVVAFGALVLLSVGMVSCSHRADAASAINLSPWKLQYATTAASNEVYPIGSFQKSPYFVDVAGGIQFRAYCDGKPTSGSQYPRSELREMTASGAKASWSTKKGSHVMTLTTRVTHTPTAKPQVVVAQIHGTTSDFVIVEYDAGTHNLFWKLKSKIKGNLATGVPLGATLNLKLQAVNGTVSIFVDNVKKATTTTSTSTAYFKAGAYVQSNPAHGDGASAYGEVVISSLSITATK